MHVTYNDSGSRKSSNRYLNLAGSIINALPLDNHYMISMMKHVNSIDLHPYMLRLQPRS